MKYSKDDSAGQAYYWERQLLVLAVLVATIAFGCFVHRYEHLLLAGVAAKVAAVTSGRKAVVDY